MQKKIAALSVIILICTPLHGMEQAYKMLMFITNQGKQNQTSTKKDAPHTTTVPKAAPQPDDRKDSDNASSASDGDLTDLLAFFIVRS